MKTDAMNLARKCDKCQRFSSIPISHPEKLTSMTSPWPFAVWGIDLIGPMPTACLAFKYAVVAVDYFTTWVEAKPLGMISSKKVQEFVWESIICHFRIPHDIVSDNGTQFDKNDFRALCDDFRIKKSLSSVDHPHTNGQLEAISNIIKFNLKMKLEECKWLWAEELPKVLWAYKTTSRTSMGETPFSLQSRSHDTYRDRSTLPETRNVQSRREFRTPTIRTRPSQRETQPSSPQSRLLQTVI